jgi:hypothetical protein
MTPIHKGVTECERIRGKCATGLDSHDGRNVNRTSLLRIVVHGEQTVTTKIEGSCRQAVAEISHTLDAIRRDRTVVRKLKEFDSVDPT